MTAAMARTKIDRSAEAPAYEIRRSPIHGTGVFAARNLRKGERIVEYTGEKISKAESERRGLDLMEKARHDGGAAVYIFSLDERWDLDGDRPDNDARLINHSCDPNCEALNYDNRLFIEAIRAIQKGEELSFNYGFTVDTWEDHPCRCGAPRCAGFIVAREEWPKLRRAIAEKNGNGVNGKRVSGRKGTGKKAAKRQR